MSFKNVLERDLILLSHCLSEPLSILSRAFLTINSLLYSNPSSLSINSTKWKKKKTAKLEATSQPPRKAVAFGILLLSAKILTPSECTHVTDQIPPIKNHQSTISAAENYPKESLKCHTKHFSFRCCPSHLPATTRTKLLPFIRPLFSTKSLCQPHPTHRKPKHTSNHFNFLINYHDPSQTTTTITLTIINSSRYTFPFPIIIAGKSIF